MLFTTNLNTYQQLNDISINNFSCVYIVKKYNTKLKQTLKQHNLENINLETFKLIQYEIFVNRLLSHPNVLKFSECYVKHDKLWCFMPYYSYGSLSNMIHCFFTHGLPEQISMKILYDVGKALTYLHDRNLIHRNVCSDNIFMSNRGVAHLAGLQHAVSMYSPILGKREPKLYDFPSICTHRLILSGSPEFLAQDLKGYDQKTDIYSLGLIACQMLNGILPFYHLENTQILLEKIGGNMPGVLSVGPGNADSDNMKASQHSGNQLPANNVKNKLSTNVILTHPVHGKDKQQRSHRISSLTTASNQIPYHNIRVRPSLIELRKDHNLASKGYDEDDNLNQDGGHRSSSASKNSSIGTSAVANVNVNKISSSSNFHLTEDELTGSLMLVANIPAFEGRRFSHESSIASSGYGGGGRNIIVRRSVIPFREDILRRNSLPVFPYCSTIREDGGGGGKDGEMMPIGFHKSVLERLTQNFGRQENDDDTNNSEGKMGSSNEILPKYREISLLSDGASEDHHLSRESIQDNKSGSEVGKMSAFKHTQMDNGEPLCGRHGQIPDDYKSKIEESHVVPLKPNNLSSPADYQLGSSEKINALPSLSSEHSSQILPKKKSSITPIDLSVSSYPVLKSKSYSSPPIHNNDEGENRDTSNAVKKRRKLRFFHVTKVANGITSDDIPIHEESNNEDDKMQSLQLNASSQSHNQRSPLRLEDQSPAPPTPSSSNKLSRSLFARLPFWIYGSKEASPFQRKRYRSMFIPGKGRSSDKPTKDVDLNNQKLKNIKKYSIDSSAIQQSSSSHNKLLIMNKENFLTGSSISSPQGRLPDPFCLLTGPPTSSSGPGLQYLNHSSAFQRNNRRRRSTFAHFFSGSSSSHFILGGNPEYKAVLDLRSFALLCLKFNPEDRPSAEAILTLPLFKRVHKFRPETLQDSINARKDDTNAEKKHSPTSTLLDSVHLQDRSKSPAVASWKF